MTSVWKLARSLLTIQRHPSADSNASPLRIIWQALPRFLSSKGYSRPPLSIFFIINSRCNMKCQMCDVGQNYSESIFYKNLIGGEGQQKGDDFPIERFESLMEEVKEFKPFISITSTEPLLYGALPLAVEAARSRGMNTNVTTNGLLLSRRHEELFSCGLKSLTLSLDGPSEVHDRIRGVPGGFEHILEGIQNLIDLKERKNSLHPTISVNSVITNLNVGSLKPLLDSLPMQYIHQVSFTLMTFCHQELADRHNAIWGDKYPATRTSVEGDCDPFQVDADALHDELEAIRKRYRKKVHFFFDNSSAYLHTYFHRPEEFLDSRFCVFPWFTAQITSNGDLIGVTRCFHRFFGNILNSRFEEAWNGPEMREFRKDLRKQKRFPACTRCEGVLY